MAARIAAKLSAGNLVISAPLEAQVDLAPLIYQLAPTGWSARAITFVSGAPTKSLAVWAGADSFNSTCPDLLQRLIDVLALAGADDVLRDLPVRIDKHETRDSADLVGAVHVTRFVQASPKLVVVVVYELLDRRLVFVADRQHRQ